MVKLKKFTEILTKLWKKSVEILKKRYKKSSGNWEDFKKTFEVNFVCLTFK